MSRAKREYLGNIPDSPLLAAAIADNRDWGLYLRHTSEAKGVTYLNLKLVCPGGHPRKANYWLGYNTKTGAYSRTKDAALLADQEPGLCAWVAEVAAECEPTASGIARHGREWFVPHLVKENGRWAPTRKPQGLRDLF